MAIMVQPKQYYDLAELSARMGIGVRTIRRYVGSGQLKARKVGRKFFVSSSDLQKFLGEE